MSVVELSRLTEETKVFYQNKFMSKRERAKNVDGLEVPDIIFDFEPITKGKLLATYLRTWEFFRDSLDAELYFDYAEQVYYAQRDYTEWIAEGGEGEAMDFNLKRCIIALIDAELEDLQVEVKKLKNNSKYSSGGVSVKAGNAIAEIKDKVLNLIMNRKIELVDVTNTKCHLLNYLKSS